MPKKDVFVSMVLPSNYDDMEKFIIKNKSKLTEQVVYSINYALNHKLQSVEVFKFKNSEFVIVLDKSTFKVNINGIFEYYLQTEQYELCNEVCKLQKLLNNHEKEK